MAMPTKSQLRAWSTTHLTDAAAEWNNTADNWEDAFTTVAREIGVPWKGEAADAAMRQAAADRVKVVTTACDPLRNAARIASDGAGRIQDAKNAALYAIARAVEDGFSVGEDLSVTDPNFSPTAANSAAREALGQAHANAIGTKALKLVALEHKVAAGVTGAAANIGQINFADAPLNYPSAEEVIQAVDYKTSTGPGDELDPGDLEAIERANLDLLHEMETEYRQLPDGQVRSDRLADLAAIREGLKVDDSHLIFLEKPDSPDQMIPAAIAVGDPYTADHVSVTVPGVSSTTRGAIAGMTQEAGQLREAARDIAGRRGESPNVATIAWTGYQPPANLGSSDALTDNLAQAGAPNSTLSSTTSTLHRVTRTKPWHCSAIPTAR